MTVPARAAAAALLAVAVGVLAAAPAGAADAGNSAGTYQLDGTGPWIAPVYPSTDRNLILFVGEPRPTSVAALDGSAFTATQQGRTLRTAARRVAGKDLSATIVLDRTAGADELNRERAGALSIVGTLPEGVTIGAVDAGPGGEPAYTETSAQVRKVVNAAVPGPAPTVDAQLAIVTRPLFSDPPGLHRDVVVLGPCRQVPAIPSNALARVWMIATSGTCTPAIRAAITATGGRLIDATRGLDTQVAGERFVAALAGLYRVTVTASPGAGNIQLAVATGRDGTVQYAIPPPLATNAAAKRIRVGQLLGFAGGAVVVAMLLVAVVRIGRGAGTGGGDGPAGAAPPDGADPPPPARDDDLAGPSRQRR